MAGSFYTREVGVLTEVSVTEQVSREISEILGKLEIIYTTYIFFIDIYIIYIFSLGKLSMRKQCVPGSFLPAHTRAWEQG